MAQNPGKRIHQSREEEEEAPEPEENPAKVARIEPSEEQDDIEESSSADSRFHLFSCW